MPGEFACCSRRLPGSGTALGATFEEIAADHRARAGADATTRRRVHRHRAHFRRRLRYRDREYDDVIARFDAIVGLERLGAMHLNDSKAPLGSRRDRHELIGEGAIGELAFRRIMTDERLTEVPKLIETPKLDNAAKTDRRMLRRLRRLRRWLTARWEGANAAEQRRVAVARGPPSRIEFHSWADRRRSRARCRA